MHAHFASACMTRAFAMRNYLEQTALENGYDRKQFLWRFHSFGFRGHNSLEDAYWAGTAWSTFLPGTDNFHITAHMPENWLIGSINALAHKVTQQYDNEFDCFYHAVSVTEGSENPIVAMVIDTYDADNVIDNAIVPVTKFAKEKGVHCVWRPDSGLLFDQAVRIYNKLTEAGLGNFSIIIGEGMSFGKASEFDAMFLELGIPLTKIAYGIGAGFYKDIERDTLGWAMKTAFSNGADRMKIVASDPIKQSIPGAVSLVLSDKKEIIVIPETITTLYECVYNNGVIPYAPNYADIMVRATTTLSEQENIIISDAIQLKIDSFVKKYKG